MDSFKTGDVGDTEVTLSLNVNEITFIIAGLRDIANKLVNDFRLCTTRQELEDNEQLVIENRYLADKLEAAYVGQVKA